jgi:hypothetical protein
VAPIKGANRGIEVPIEPECAGYDIIPWFNFTEGGPISSAMTAVGIADPAVSHVVQGLRTAYGASAKAAHFIDKYTQK